MIGAVRRVISSVVYYRENHYSCTYALERNDIVCVVNQVSDVNVSACYVTLTRAGLVEMSYYQLCSQTVEIALFTPHLTLVPTADTQ